MVKSDRITWWPGVPTAVVYAMAGWAGMRLSLFLLVDKYATAVSLTLIAFAVLLPLARRLIRRRR